MFRKTLLMLLAASVLAVGVVSAQQPAAPFNPYIPNPDPGCTATPAQLEANKKVAQAFFTTMGAERVALADVTYIQHNPAFIKGAREANMSDFDYFKSRFGGPPAAGRQGGGGGGPQGGAAGPQPPPTQPFEFVVAQCDIVFALRKQNLQDPTLPPGNFYEAFSFDMFRVQRGKLVEHWDMAEIAAPAAGAGGRQGGGAVSAASAQNVASRNPLNPGNLGFTPGTGPMNPCTLTPAQLQETRRVAMEFFRPGGERVSIADPRYTQHNPGFLKGGLEAKMSDFDYFKSRFGGPPAAPGGGAGGAAGGAGRGGAPATPPPAGNGTEVVLQECDMVLAVHKNFVQDPTAPAGTYYARYTFDMFRVRDSKLIEHWDGARINAPAAPAAGRGGN